MCIIIVARKGLKVPMEHFKNSWDVNSDGAGIAYNDNGVVHIKKGLMTFEDFQKALSEVPVASDRMFHFRIATSGKIVPGVTHPYPVEPNYKAMYNTDVYTSMACAHNGIISWCAPHKGLQESFSDSMAFIAGYVHPLRDSIMHNTALQELIAKATGSKFAFMTADEVITVGDFVNANDILYSNTTYKYAPIAYYTKNGKFYRDDEDWYDGCGYGVYNHTSPYVSYGKGYTSKNEQKAEIVALPSYLDNDFDEDDFQAMKDEALSSGASEPVVLSFLAKDKDRGLSYLDAEAIIDFLCSDLEIVAYGCDFDDVHKVMYMVVDWNSVIVIPEHVCNSTWSVVS